MIWDTFEANAERLTRSGAKRSKHM